MIIISDIFFKVSGVPLLERAGDEKFSGNVKWQQYKRLVPFYFHKGKGSRVIISSVPVFWPLTN